MIQSHAELNGCGIVREFLGHGIGRRIFEDPKVFNHVDSTTLRNPLALDNAVVVDAFDVAPSSPTTTEGARVEETSATYTGTWTQGDSTRTWSGGTAAVSTTAGARATFDFSGTEVRWVGLRGPQTGTARIFLDGSVLEVFTSSGRVLSTRVYPTTPPPWRVEAPSNARHWPLAH